MPVVVVATLLGLGAVFVALLRDEPMVPRGAAGHRPAWDGLPEPADLSRVTFPLSLPGYDPATVDVHLEAMLRAYEDLWVVAPHEVRERARMRADARHGRPAPAPTGIEEPPTSVTVPEPPETLSHGDALAAEAALARLEDRDAAGDT